MFEKKRPEVLVVGAGPVGLFAALSLARRGIRVTIIDAGVWPCTHSYALALHPKSLELFAGLGLLDSVLSCSYPVCKVALCDVSGVRAEMRVDRMAVIGQEVLESMLYRALRDAGVQVEWQHELSGLRETEGQVEARIDVLEKESRGYSVEHTEWTVARSLTLSAPFLIGADGHSSAVRRALNIPFEEVGPAAYYAVFEFHTDADLTNEMRIVLGDSHTDVLWPLPLGHCRWSFEIPGFTGEDAPRWKDRNLLSHVNFPILREDRLRDFLLERAPWFHGNVENFTWRTLVRFERRLAGAFGAGRCWLAGDAAHLTGPVGMQSMNVGFQEAAKLSDILCRLLRDGGDFSELGDYGAQSLQVWNRLHGAGHGLKPGPHTDEWVALRAPRLLSCLPASGDALSSMASQLGLDY